MMEYHNPKVTELKSKILKVYCKPDDYYILDGYLQSKLYPAVKQKKIRFLSYRKEHGNKRYYVFAIKDIMEFLDNPLARNIQQQKWVDVQINEPEI